MKSEIWIGTEQRRRQAPGSWYALALVVLAILVLPRMVRAGQDASPPPLIMPGNQGSQTSTLELPTTPTNQGGALNIPPQVPGKQGGELNIPQVPGPQEGQELTLPTAELRNQPGYSQVTVTVTNPDGTYVTGLQKDDFKLFLDGQQRPIEFFRQDLNTPVSVGILVDTSGSMQPKIAQAQMAISDFLNELNAHDDVFLFAFSSRPYLLQPFTTNHELVERRLSLLRAYGQTALFDVIIQGLRMVEHGRYDKKALLVVTDGMDNTSASSVNDVVAQARRMGVLVYSIGIGDPNAGSMPSIAIGPFVFGGSDIERVDTQTLHTLSTETGARTYVIRQVGDGAALRQACQQISLELREQYTVGFVAPDASAGGYRSVRVDAPSHPGDSVRVRKGVEVGGPAAYASEPGGAPGP
ncbi:MAG: VWA domain-containing protein [Candidatus Binataceae bacterium]